MEELGDFIKTHQNYVQSLIYRSPYRPCLSWEDHNELIYMGLWKVHRTFNPEKSTLNFYIKKVITSYILDLYIKKRRNKIKTVELSEDISYSDENIKEHFTDEEWEFLSPRVEKHSIEDSAKIKKTSKFKYSKKLKAIQAKYEGRLNK